MMTRKDYIDGNTGLDYHLPMEDDQILTTEEAAEYLSVTKHALKTWRDDGKGPVYLKFSNNVIRYRRSDLDEYLEEIAVNPLDQEQPNKKSKYERSRPLEIKADGPDDLLSSMEAAQCLGISEATLRSWRVIGRGPKFIKHKTGSIRYRRKDIDAYLADSEQKSTREYRRHRGKGTKTRS